MKRQIPQMLTMDTFMYVRSNEKFTRNEISKKCIIMKCKGSGVHLVSFVVSVISPSLKFQYPHIC